MAGFDLTTGVRFYPTSDTLPASDNDLPFYFAGVLASGSAEFGGPAGQYTVVLSAANGDRIERTFNLQVALPEIPGRSVPAGCTAGSGDLP